MRTLLYIVLMITAAVAYNWAFVKYGPALYAFLNN